MATETREILFKFTASEIEIQKSLEKVSQALVGAQKQLKDLNKSFTAANKIIDSYDDNLDQLNSQLQANEISQEQYNNSVNELNNELKAANNSVARYAKEQTNLKQEIKKLSTEQRGYIKDLNNLEKVTDKAEGSNEQLRASVSLLTKEYNKLSKEERETTQRGQLLTKTLREQTDALKENEKAVGDNRRNVGNYQDAFSGLTGGITETIGSLAGPGGLIAGIGLAADLIGDGIVAVQEITSEFVTFRGEVGKLTSETGDDLDKLTSRVVNISRVFGKDFNEVLTLVNQQSKDFGISFLEATDNVQNGFINSVNNGEKFTEILEEYSPIFADIGFTAQETNGIINQQIKDGVYSDKGIDALKEARERLLLMEKPAQDALKALQIDPQKLEGLSLFEQIKLISGELSKFPKDSQEAAIAIDGIFGTPGLDAGFRYLTNLKDINLETQSLRDETNPLIALQLKQLEVGNRLAEAQNELSKAFEGSNGELSLLIDEGKIFLIEVLLGIINRLKPVFESLGQFIDFIGKVGDAFGFVGDKVNEFLKGIGLITEDIEFFGSAAEVVVDALVNVFTGGFGLIFDSIGFAFDLLKDFINFATTIPDRLSNIFNTFKEFSNDLLGTDFTIDPQIKIDTTEAEEQIDNFQIRLDDLEVPVPVAIDVNEQKARADAAKLSDAFTSEEIKANRKREQEAEKLARKLKILDQNRLKDEIAGIELRLTEVAKGSLEELNLRKNLIQKQSELALTTRQTTANEALLIIKTTQNEELTLIKEFASTKLQLSIQGLEGFKQQKESEIAEQIEATNSEIDQEAVLAEVKVSQAAEVGREKVDISKRTGEEQLDIAANALNGISQLTSAFTTFFAAQKEKQLAAAAGNAEKEEEIRVKFAKKEQALAVTKSIIDTALAVVKAYGTPPAPNIPAAILTGILGGIQTAAIASQSFASGGFTGLGFQNDPNERGRKIAGVVHDNEYVIPTNVLSTSRGMGLAMEAEKMRGFAGGGFTTPPTFSDGGIGVTQAAESNATAELGKLFKQAIASLPVPVVNVNEITDKQRRVAVKENTSGLSSSERFGFIF